MFLNAVALVLLISINLLNRKHEMFLNLKYKYQKHLHLILNRKHEMFLNSRNGSNRIWAPKLNRKHEMFLNLIRKW